MKSKKLVNFSCLCLLSIYRRALLTGKAVFTMIDKSRMAGCTGSHGISEIVGSFTNYLRPLFTSPYFVWNRRIIFREQFRFVEILKKRWETIPGRGLLKINDNFLFPFFQHVLLPELLGRDPGHRRRRMGLDDASAAQRRLRVHLQLRWTGDWPILFSLPLKSQIKFKRFYFLWAGTSLFLSQRPCHVVYIRSCLIIL